MQSPPSSESLPELRSVPALPQRNGLLTPQRMTRVLLIAAVLGVCDRSYWLYSNTDHYWPTYWMPYVQGTALAPEQYRIGVKLAAWWMVRHLHFGFRHGFALMDLVCSIPGILLLYDLLEHKRWYRAASRELQWFASAAFVMLTCFYLAWIESYFRPETLPTTGLVAAMAWLWSRRQTRPQNPGQTPRDDAPSRPARQGLIILGLLAASALQATIRADVVCLLSAGMLVVSLFAWGPGISLPRRAAILASAACGLLAAGIQLYIMRVLYPHASYGPIPILMVRYDFRQPLSFPPFLFFIVPVAWTVLRFWRRRPPPDAANSGLLLASVLYFLLWVVMGKLDEVRIFVPFALALAPLSIELAVRMIQGSPQHGTQDNAQQSAASRTGRMHV